jgi:hypothetical protein
MPKRFLPRFFAVAVGLLAIGLVSFAVRANDALAGKFTLHHPTQLDKTVLPAGEYTFQVSRVPGQNVDLFAVQGANQKVRVLVHGDWACERCQSGSLNLAVQGDRYAVASLEVARFHAKFKVLPPAGAKAEELAQLPKSTEQVAVHVNPN